METLETETLGLAIIFQIKKVNLLRSNLNQEIYQRPCLNSNQFIVIFSDQCDQALKTNFFSLFPVGVVRAVDAFFDNVFSVFLSPLPVQQNDVAYIIGWFLGEIWWVLILYLLFLGE